MGENLPLSCGTCGREVVGTAPVKGAHPCALDCAEWVRDRPNLLIRFWHWAVDK